MSECKLAKTSVPYGDEQMSRSPSLQLMFLATKKFDSGKAIRGAFLLTDLNTKPVEFRCTNPIRPTTLQTMLYGDTLEQHIMVELIGLPLITSLKDRPALILIREAVFMRARPRVEIPIIRLVKEESLAVSSTGEGNPTQLLHSASGRFDPVVLAAHAKFSSDREQAKAILAEIFDNHDLLEPFDRIESALEQVHAQKIGEEK